MLAWALAEAARGLLRRVEGPSMRPTLRPGDVVLVVPARVAPPAPGAVVVLVDPRDPTRATIKRVSAVTGEVADLPDGPAAVPAGHVAVAGDDPRASTDSRVYGAVPVASVRARVVARVWPRPALTRRRPAR